MSEKVRTLAEVRKEKWLKQVEQARALGEVATSSIDEALAENAQVIQFPDRKPEIPDGAA
jgi:hypothetical protein